MKILTTLTANIEGKEHPFVLSELEAIIANQKIAPHIISLTEVRREDILELHKNKHIDINNNRYHVLVPKLCPNNSCTSFLGTCLLVEQATQELFRFHVIEASVTTALKHVNDPCDIRECRIKSTEYPIQVISLYVPQGISGLNYKKAPQTAINAKHVLSRLIPELEVNLHSKTKFIYLGDFNLYTPNNVTNFSEMSKRFRNISLKFDPWYLTQTQNIATFGWNKLDYILSNLPFDNSKLKNISLKSDFPNFSKHNFLYASYYLFKE
ncbi:exonuclease/endonuclease/phosphatase family protein [Streptococcus suis]|uniref:hypothetical protein n=1 Tax=Streptococcus suis TaxID=1307 RepID=UPI003757EFC6